MILVVDVTKGMQTQTAECLVIGEITCTKMIVVLNKVDLISKDKKDTTIEKVCEVIWIAWISLKTSSGGGANRERNGHTPPFFKEKKQKLL